MQKSVFMGVTLALAALLATGVALGRAEAGNGAPEIAPARVSGDQAKALVAEGALLVDVRTPAEFAANGIPGAINVPVHELESRLSELGAKDGKVVVYCHSGRRSALAARKLQDAGFSSVYDLGARTRW